MELFSDEYFMREALKEARKAFDRGEIPIGAIVVADNKIIARAHNSTEQLNDVTAHAEMLAITAAANYMNGKYLKKCSLYVTLEPCIMCAGALGWSQIDKIIVGAKDEKKGFSSFKPIATHPKTVVTYGVLELECGALLQDFFKRLRN